MHDQVNVVIIEDHTILMELLAESLTDSMGIVVTTQCRDAESALQLLPDQRVDIAIVYNYLPYPGMSGIEFTKRARAREDIDTINTLFNIKRKPKNALPKSEKSSGCQSRTTGYAGGS